MNLLCFIIELVIIVIDNFKWSTSGEFGKIFEGISGAGVDVAVDEVLEEDF